MFFYIYILTKVVKSALEFVLNVDLAHFES